MILTLPVVIMTRRAVKPFTFSNGMHIPKGAFVECALLGAHHDGRNYADPDVFDPWRFSSMHQAEGGSTKHQLVTTSNEFLIFGHGRHAWSVAHLQENELSLIVCCISPGRFFVSVMLKLAIARMILDYDLSFENEGAGYPPDTYLNGFCLPADAEVVFQRKGASL